MSDSRTLDGTSPLGVYLKKTPRSQTYYFVYDGLSKPSKMKISIGRSDKNDLCIEDELVSRKHAVIKKDDENYFIKDLKSKNGTFVNGHMLAPNEFVNIQENDLLKIGRTEIVFKKFF
ncbi:MAG: FHA domain-containing protein [Spirochaetales bacterium]|nr:FHA domain-containing protein [Spirochaetales bacterium]